MKKNKHDGSIIDRTIAAARLAQPALWDRTDRIARIIDPGAFCAGTVFPKESQAAFNARLKYQQACAMRKAQEVLQALGVNTDADWYVILSEMGRGTSNKKRSRA